MRRYVPFTQRHGEKYPIVPTDSNEPRCDVTGTRLTVRERFERECG